MQFPKVFLYQFCSYIRLADIGERGKPYFMHIFASIVDNFVDNFISFLRDRFYAGFYTVYKVIHNLENTKAGVMVLDERL